MVRTPGSRVKPPLDGARLRDRGTMDQGTGFHPGRRLLARGCLLARGLRLAGGSASQKAPPCRELLLSQAVPSIAIPEDPRTSLLTRSSPTSVP